MSLLNLIILYFLLLPHSKTTCRTFRIYSALVCILSCNINGISLAHLYIYIDLHTVFSAKCDVRLLERVSI